MVYFSFVIISFIYLMFKYHRSAESIFIILCFYSGLAAYLGKLIENPYKVILALLSVRFMFKYNILFASNRNIFLIITTFIIFTIFFLISASLGNSYFVLTFSQYNKYFVPFVCLLIFYKISKNYPIIFTKLKSLIFNLIIIQVLLSILKLFILGVQESIVGTVSYIGGGSATLLPVLGFIFIWLERKGELRRKDWILAILLLFIGFTSNKRAVWFIMPAIIFTFMVFVKRVRIKAQTILYIILLIPIITYIGIRLNPTLNKEHKYWGSFDPKFTYNYIMYYNFGANNGEQNNKLNTGKGRGGVTMMLINKTFNNEQFSKEDWLGYGLTEMYTTDYGTFDDDKFGINSKGAITGIFQTYISTGYIGIISSLFYIFSTLFLIKEIRIRLVIIGLFIWEYFFYIGMLFNLQVISILLFFIIIYINNLYEKGIFQKFTV